MSKFIKLTVNDSLYDTLVSLSELYSLPVATLCNFLLAIVLMRFLTVLG